MGASVAIVVHMQSQGPTIPSTDQGTHLVRRCNQNVALKLEVAKGCNWRGFEEAVRLSTARAGYAGAVRLRRVTMPSLYRTQGEHSFLRTGNSINTEHTVCPPGTFGGTSDPTSCA